MTTQFPKVVFYDDGTSQTIEFARDDGAATSVVILDDGWTPAVTKYVRDGRVTWGEVVEELDCMTNTSTRDAALNLIETLNAMIHRAKRYLDSDNTNSVILHVRSQFSTSAENATARVLGPPDDGAVIQLSADFQTSPPGAIRFRLRFKRNGLWSFGTSAGYVTTLSSAPWSLYAGAVPMPASAILPTPVSIAVHRSPSGGLVSVRRMFCCFGAFGATSSFANEWNTNNTSIAEKITISSSFAAYQNIVMLFKATSNVAAYATKTLNAGTYAVFLTYRVRQANTVHSVQLTFDDANTATDNVLLSSTNTNPDIVHAGTITLPTQNSLITIRVGIGHSSGFELGEVIFVRLSDISSIIEMQSWTWNEYANLYVENAYNKNTQYVKQAYYFSSTPTVINVFDSLDVVMTATTNNVAVAGVSDGTYTLVTMSNERITSLTASVEYIRMRTMIQ